MVEAFAASGAIVTGDSCAAAWANLRVRCDHLFLQARFGALCKQRGVTSPHRADRAKRSLLPFFLPTFLP